MYFRYTSYGYRSLLPFAYCCCIFLLAACGQNVAATPPVTTAHPPRAASTSTTVSPQVLHSCPQSGTARAAVMPPLATGSHQVILYTVDTFDAKTHLPITTLRRYDVTTGHKTDLLKIAGEDVNQLNLSPDGQWITFVSDSPDGQKLQMMRIDGQVLQTLSCSDGIGSMSWSPDQKQIAFVGALTTAHGIQRGTYLFNVQSGNIQLALPSGNEPPAVPGTWLDNTHVYLFGGVKLRSSATTHPGGISAYHTLQVPLAQYTGSPLTPPDKLYLLDTTKGANQTIEDLQLVYQAPPQDTIMTWSASSLPGATQVFISQCAGTGSAPCTINALPTTGGPGHVVYSSAKLTVIRMQMISASSILLFIYNPSNPPNDVELWKMNTDGTGLTHVITTSFVTTDYRLNPWSILSRNGNLYVMQVSTFHDYSVVRRSMVFAALNGGQPTTFEDVDVALGFRILGWTTM